MISINIKADLKPLHRTMIALGAKQVPFATSLALNTLAKGVAADQVDLIDETFETPTPFTERAYRIEAATKAKPIAVVAAKDIQASYLEPYVTGGQRSLGTKRGMLAPRGVALNQYGNLTKGKMKALKGKRDVFVGAIKTRSGRTISGVWQRPIGAKRPKPGRAAGAQPQRKLKLLIAFEDTTTVRKRLPFEQRARTYLSRNAASAFDQALRRAMITARR